jgi:hypothetical protein
MRCRAQRRLKQELLEAAERVRNANQSASQPASQPATSSLLHKECMNEQMTNG